MNNIKSYESIAREAGYCVNYTAFGGDGNISFCYTWYNPFTERFSSTNYTSTDEAYKAACIENGLVEEL